MHKFRQKLEGVQASGKEFYMFIWGILECFLSFPVFISRLSFPGKSKKRHHSLFSAFFLPLERRCFWLFCHCLFRYGRLQVELVFVASLDWSFRMLLVASDRFWSLLFPSFFSLWLCSDLYIWDTDTLRRGFAYMQRMKIQAFGPTHVFNIERNILLTTLLFLTVSVSLVHPYAYDYA